VVDGSGLENALFSASYASITLSCLISRPFQGFQALQESESAILCDGNALEMAPV
jgi:hypothetical protein